MNLSGKRYHHHDKVYCHKHLQVLYTIPAFNNKNSQANTETGQREKTTNRNSLTVDTIPAVTRNGC